MDTALMQAARATERLRAPRHSDLALDSGHWPQTGTGREYALEVAADTAGSTRPKPGTERYEIIALKLPFAV